MTYLFLANGFEEIEAITCVDILRRADIQVKTVSLMEEKLVYGAHDIPLEADMRFTECDFASARMAILPGGYEGAMNMIRHPDFRTQLKKMEEGGAYLAAICAAPMVLAKASVIGGRECTIYDGMEKELIDAYYVDKDVVVSDRIITGRGPAAAGAFALTLVAILKGEEKRDQIRKEMLYRDHDL